MHSNSARRIFRCLTPIYAALAIDCRPIQPIQTPRSLRNALLKLQVGAVERQRMPGALARGERLVDADLAALEALGRAEHVEAPDALSLLADLGDGCVAAGGEVGDPAPQRERVVLAQRLDVADLEAAGLERAVISVTGCSSPSGNT